MGTPTSLLSVTYYYIPGFLLSNSSLTCSLLHLFNHHAQRSFPQACNHLLCHAPSYFLAGPTPPLWVNSFSLILGYSYNSLPHWHSCPFYTTRIVSALSSRTTLSLPHYFLSHTHSHSLAFSHSRSLLHTSSFTSPPPSITHSYSLLLK